jgi:hypothetical protein
VEIELFYGMKELMKTEDKMKRWEKILLFGSILSIGSPLAMLVSTIIAGMNNKYPPPYWLVDFWAFCLPFLIIGIIIMLLSGKIDYFIRKLDNDIDVS